jgi:hypothetical protein
MLKAEHRFFEDDALNPIIFYIKIVYITLEKNIFDTK